MNKLRKVIQSILKMCCQNSFYRTGDRKNPYCVFTLGTVMKEDGRSILELEINCYCDTSYEVEELADNIQKHLDQLNCTDDDLSFHSYIDTRNIIEEEDKRIERRRLTFTIYYYSKEE